MTARIESGAERIGLTGLLRTLPASEVPAAQRAARDDFACRFLAATGHPLPDGYAEQWWPRAARDR